MKVKARNCRQILCLFLLNISNHNFLFAGLVLDIQNTFNVSSASGDIRCTYFPTALKQQSLILIIAGLVGAFNFFLLWPGFLFLNYLRLEVFELPPSATVWGYIALNAFIGTVLSEFLWLW